MRFYFLLVFIFLVQNITSAQEITVYFTGFKSANGKALIALYDKNEKEVQVMKMEVSNPLVCNFKNIKKGQYAVKIFHDANNNGKLDSNLIGLPTESWGVSNNVSAKFGPPSFKKMLVEVDSNIKMKIQLR